MHHDNHYSFKAPATKPSNRVCRDVVIEELVLLERLVNGITCYLRRHYPLLTRNIALNTKHKQNNNYSASNGYGD